MTYEVVVVGGGIGGLTVAALLAARGVNVCVLERSPTLGGVVARDEKFGYHFEASYGMFTGWNEGGVHSRIFAELPVAPPETRLLDPSFVVRLPEQTDVAITSDRKHFEEQLSVAFPECAKQAVEFYRGLTPIAESLQKAVAKVPDLRTASRGRQLSAFGTSFGTALQFQKLEKETVASQLGQTSARFRHFLDVQLQTLAQTSIATCGYIQGAVLLETARSSLYSLKGGGAGLAERLGESIKKSGGTIRLDTTVLRLAFGSDGNALGVDLLTGETVAASKAIISNLTLWDTYGKLVGMSQTPAEIRKDLGQLSSDGAYLIYAGLDESTMTRLPAERLLILSEWEEEGEHDPRRSQLVFAAPTRWERSAPEGKRAVTIQATTDVYDWFTYHTSEEEIEEQEQTMLEQSWRRLHAAMPELGGSIEVIETATPHTIYQNTRRKLGMVNGLPEVSNPASGDFAYHGETTHSSPSHGSATASSASQGASGPGLPARGLPVRGLLGHRTHLPNLFRVGDTCFPGPGLAAVSHSALITANEIAG